MGAATQYAWSTSVCVRIKLYVQIATLILAATSYGMSESEASQIVRKWNASPSFVNFRKLEKQKVIKINN